MVTCANKLITMVLGLALLAGCGPARLPSGTVAGTVTLDGEPVRAGVVSFFSDAMGVGASADLNQEGAYRITQEMPAGEYQVSIDPPSPPMDEETLARMEQPGYQPDVPAEYREAYSASGLRATIQTGTNEINFDL